MVTIHAEEESERKYKDQLSTVIYVIQGDERLGLKMSRLVEQISKRPIPPHTKQFLVEVVASDAEGEDVEVSLSGLTLFGDS